jgi:hypothetical protein
MLVGLLYILSCLFGLCWVEVDGVFNCMNIFVEMSNYFNNFNFDLELIKTNIYKFFSFEIPKRYDNFIDEIPNNIKNFRAELPELSEVLPKIIRFFALFFIMIYLTMNAAVYAFQFSHFIPSELITLVLDQYELLARIPVIISDFINLSCDCIFGRFPLPELININVKDLYIYFCSGVFNYFMNFINYMSFHAVTTEYNSYIPEIILEWLLDLNYKIQEFNYNRDNNNEWDGFNSLNNNINYNNNSEYINAHDNFDNDRYRYYR